METAWASDPNVAKAADYLGIRPDQVRTAVGCYTELADEVDSWIRRNRDEAERLQERWKREQASLRR